MKIMMNSLIGRVFTVVWIVSIMCVQINSVDQRLIEKSGFLNKRFWIGSLHGGPLPVASRLSSILSQLPDSSGSPPKQARYWKIRYGR